MFDPVIVVNVIFAAAAVIYGFCSRNLATAVVAGIWLALVHTALLALVYVQSGAMAELPYLKDGVDLAMATGYLGFAHARVIVYFAGVGLILLAGMVALYLVKWALASLLGLARPAAA